MTSFHSESIDSLFQTILSLRTVEECYDYFEDLCTIQEIQTMAQRWDAAKLLDEGLGYQKIQGRIGISTATIGRVSRCLRYGTGGYRKMLDRHYAENGEKPGNQEEQ